MKVYIVTCSVDSGGYVLGAYEDKEDAHDRRVQADHATVCAPHDVVLQYTIEKKGRA